jgi:hypothetical protein
LTGRNLEADEDTRERGDEKERQSRDKGEYGLAMLKRGEEGQRDQEHREAKQFCKQIEISAEDGESLSALKDDGLIRAGG